jgi:Tfp pilus assembly protein PilO
MLLFVVCQGCDLSGLLSFDPESIEPAHSTARDEPSPSVIADQLQRLKALLSSPIETLVENSEEVKNILEEIQPHVPVTLQLKLWPVVTLSAFRSRVQLARQRIDLRHTQLPLKADIADKCQWLNEKKAALDANTDTSVSTAELEILRKELKDLEEKVRVTKELICDKEASIARSQREAEGLKAELKTDLAEIRALNKQLVTGKDDDDKAEIAEVDHVRAGALRALETFLQ